MKSIMVKIAKQIIQRHDAHVTAYMVNLQARLDQAFKNDKTHTDRLSQ